MPVPSEFPLELANRCVKCGLCLPHCPTYQLTGIEGESPRGRIALMQGLALGRLEPGAGLVAHLDRCLGCRACEKVCPANVPYGELIDAGRALLVERGVRPPLQQKLLRRLLKRPGLLRAALRAARLPGVARMLHGLGGVSRRAAQMLPREAKPSATPTGPTPFPAIAGEVLVFAGCAGTTLDRGTVDDVATALAAAGWRARMPGGQACCGAVDLHGGDPAEARALARRNLDAFQGDGMIVACATGCSATLKEYARLAGEDGARFAGRVRDPVELLADADLALRPGPYRNVVLHVPCTQRNVTGSGPATRRLLNRLPGLAWREVGPGCCGAAGEMFISHPEMSDALLAPLLADIARDPPDAVITSNVGCALHLSAGLARGGTDVPVLHPATLMLSALE
jgi:glycolate oxidase iron-sulfur subunit